MDFLKLLYTEILWRPLFNGLLWLYAVVPVHDLGLAIVILTVVIRLLLAPLLWKGGKAQRALAALQPEIQKVRDNHRDNREAQGKALFELYAKHKVNPFSGCLMIIIQLPILIALFQVFQQGFDPAALVYRYPFVPDPGELNPISFGILDVRKGNVVLGIIAAALQYFQARLSLRAAAPPQGDFAKALNWQTLYVFPALIIVWSVTFPSALTLYWTVLNVFGIVQEIIMKKRAP